MSEHWDCLSTALWCYKFFKTHVPESNYAYLLDISFTPKLTFQRTRFMCNLKFPSHCWSAIIFLECNEFSSSVLEE